MNRLPRGYHDVLVYGLSAYLVCTSLRSWLTEGAALGSIQFEVNERAKAYHFKLVEDYNKVMSSPD